MQTRNINLPITVTGRHMELTSAIKEYARKKIEGLHLDFPKIIEAKVILDVVDFRHHTEILLFCSNHITLEASAVTEDTYASMDEAINKIARQMRKAKTRLMKSSQPQENGSIRHLGEDQQVLEDFDLDEAPANHLLETDRNSLQSLNVDEARLQLEISDQPFLLFINSETGKPNVLHRRNGEEAAAMARTAAAAAVRAA